MATLVRESGDVSDPSNDSPADRMIQRDTGLQEITTKFENDFSIEPDADLNLDLSDSTPRDSDTASNSSSFPEVDENLEDNSDDSTKPKKNINNGDKPKSLNDSSSLRSAEEEPDAHLKSEVKGSKKKKAKDNSKTASDAESLGSKKESSASSMSKNPLKLLKRLTKFDKSSKRKSSFNFATIVVDKLPQVFVVKYLGHREVPGVSGLQHIRKPVDEMVQQVRAKFDAKEEVRLPLLYVVVSEKGLELREHQSNKEKGTAPLGLMPIDFISYGVQDIKYWKVFTCIVVRSLSWQMRSATCHAFFCDSPHSGRKMALSLGAAFNVYAKKLKADGKSHNFQVELRPPDEIVDEISECDA
ncbi:unnamed protein product [Candidula unifasciata]|uniref:PID domain-containing protein n=1 Tax=Candidula unifasciata TaxID=100452 RepID=A0A8S3YQI7_9EUPU|nr:unnamed protein product [Candidula unifasciata]